MLVHPMNIEHKDHIEKMLSLWNVGDEFTMKHGTIVRRVR